MKVRESATAGRRRGREMIWANLLHLSYNMWADREADAPWFDWAGGHICAKPYLRFNSDLWDDILKKMVDAGMNMVVIDLGDGVKYESHPEIAVHKAWTVSRLRRELAKMRKMGLEPIPKLNFSASHDVWLGPYSRCLSTDAYYGVCRDLIAEVISLFDKPRLFHLGMDEEMMHHQQLYQYAQVRQFDLWWHDFLFLVKQMEKAGVRAWIWSDYLWDHREEFLKKMPRSVLQSNWHYLPEVSKRVRGTRGYLDLEAHRYDQVPTGCNYYAAENFERTVRFCSKNIASRRLLGFMQTTWAPTLEPFRRRHMDAIECVARARAWLARSR